MARLPGVALRQFTHTCRPLGSATFVAELERSAMRPLAPHKRGRRKTADSNFDQSRLSFVT